MAALCTPSATEAADAMLDATASGKRPREVVQSSMRAEIDDLRADIMDYLGSALERMADRVDKRITTACTELSDRIDVVGSTVLDLGTRQDATATDQADLRVQVELLAKHLDDSHRGLEADQKTLKHRIDRMALDARTAASSANSAMQRVETAASMAQEARIAAEAARRASAGTGGLPSDDGRYVVRKGGYAHQPGQ